MSAMWSTTRSWCWHQTLRHRARRQPTDKRAPRLATASPFSSSRRDVAFWHFASFRCGVIIRRFWIEADLGPGFMSTRPNDLTSLCRNDAASAWPQRAAHEDHIGMVPARRRKRTKFVLLIKTDIARPLSGDDVDARTSRARSLRGKRSDQSGANTATTVAFVEINVQMARIGIAQWRK